MSTGTLSLGWVSDALKMVYNRSQQQNGAEGNESYWLAWNADGSYYLEDGHRVAENLAYAWKAGVPLEQMERVVWMHQLPDGRVVDGWLSVDLSRKWNSQTQTWETL